MQTRVERRWCIGLSDRTRQEKSHTGQAIRCHGLDRSRHGDSLRFVCAYRSGHGNLLFGLIGTSDVAEQQGESLIGVLLAIGSADRDLNRFLRLIASNFDAMVKLLN